MPFLKIINFEQLSQANQVNREAQVPKAFQNSQKYAIVLNTTNPIAYPTLVSHKA